MESSSHQKSHQKSKKSSKNPDDLPSSLQKIYSFLKINPTFTFVQKKLQKDKRIVSRDLRRLIKRGFVKRIDKGLYKVIIKDKVVPCSHQKSSYFRLHNLEIHLRVSSDHHKIINSMLIKNKQYFNLRGFGNVGNYFDLEVTGLITKEGIFLMYPEGWELTANTSKELFLNLYTLIEETVKKWEQRFNLRLFKDNRINFDIRNLHVAYIEDGLVKEFQKRNIEYLMIRDDEDNKPRFVIDMSKGFPEFEALHPQKALSDTDEIEFWGNTLKDGKYRELYNRHLDFFNGCDNISLKHILSLLEEQAKINNDTALGLNALIKLCLPKNKDSSSIDNGRPDYFG